MAKSISLMTKVNLNLLIRFELSQVWKSLDSVEQANITTMIAGATQANVFNGIMTNMSEGAEAVATSLNSSGSAAQENARWMDSI